MAMDEVEDAVRAWAGAVDEVGPGHRALRRNAGAETAESASRAQLGQVGQQALLHHAAQARVHAVDADHDDSSCPGLRETRVRSAEDPARPPRPPPSATRRGSFENGRVRSD